MTQIKKIVFLLLLILGHFGNAQEKIPIREYLLLVETDFPYNFSFKDEDLKTHIIAPNRFEDIDATLAYLRQNSLFQFEVLNDKTVAISKKPELIKGCGQVFSSEGSIPLDNLVVTSRYQQLFTDSEGRFDVLAATSEDTITLTYQGYEETVISADSLQNNPCTSITVEPKVEYLSTVTLSNYFAKGISKETNGSLSVNYDDFDILPGLIEPDVLLTLQALPGIQSVNERVSFINIRGGTNDQNLILWDGIKMYQNGHFFGLISAFNPFLTQEVTVFKNGTPAAYGDGVSGIISMASAREPDPEFSVGAGINLLSADLFANVPLGKKGSFQISGRKSINNVVETPTYSSYFDQAFQNTELTSSGGNALPNSNDDFSFFDTSLRVLLEPTEKDHLRLNFIFLANDLEFLENAEIDNNEQSLKSDLIQNNLSAGLYYKRQWNQRWSTDLQLYGTTYKLQALNQNILNNQALLQENDVLESGVKFNSSYLISEKLMGNLGYQWNETGITNFERINNPFFERTDKQVIRTNSLFAEANYRPFEATYINLGVRANHIGKFNEILVEPRLSVSHRFLEYFTVELLGELKSQTTSQIIDFQNDFLGVENRRWVLSKPDEIPIVKGRQLSAGISVNRKGWLVSAEPYIKKVTGITSQSQGFQNQFENERTHGSYTVLGVDLLVNKRFKKINTWLSYSYAENDYDFDTFVPSEFHNNIDIRHTVTYGVNYSFNDFNISGGFNWHSGKPTTLLVADEPIANGQLNFEAPNASNIKDYLRVDLSGTYKFNVGKNTRAFVGMSIWNVLDTENIVNHFFRLNADGEIEEIDEFALGFTPNLSFRITF
ncbi:MAG: TonB-dependent receptor plug domain-containing protein [Bacteroidota bacterium]